MSTIASHLVTPLSTEPYPFQYYRKVHIGKRTCVNKLVETYALKFQFPDNHIHELSINPSDYDSFIDHTETLPGHVSQCRSCAAWFYSSETKYRFCSPICSAAKNREIKNRYMTRYNSKSSATRATVRSSKTCAICGIPFPAKSVKRTYCSDACRQKAFRQNRDKKISDLISSLE